MHKKRKLILYILWIDNKIDINYNIKVDFNIAPEKPPLERAKELVFREID